MYTYIYRTKKRQEGEVSAVQQIPHEEDDNEAPQRGVSEEQK